MKLFKKVLMTLTALGLCASVMAGPVLEAEFDFIKQEEDKAGSVDSQSYFKTNRLRLRWTGKATDDVSYDWRLMLNNLVEYAADVTVKGALEHALVTKTFGKSFSATMGLIPKWKTLAYGSGIDEYSNNLIYNTGAEGIYLTYTHDVHAINLFLQNDESGSRKLYKTLKYTGSFADKMVGVKASYHMAPNGYPGQTDTNLAASVCVNYKPIKFIADYQAYEKHFTDTWITSKAGNATRMEFRVNYKHEKFQPFFKYGTMTFDKTYNEYAPSTHYYDEETQDATMTTYELGLEYLPAKGQNYHIVYTADDYEKIGDAKAKKEAQIWAGVDFAINLM